jgi:methyl-accepting chemotaxis protein
VDEAGSANKKAQGLEVAAGKVGEVIGLINDIASQTN